METFEFNGGKWQLAIKAGSKSFVCWNCNNPLASENAYFSEDNQHGGNKLYSSIYICHHCNAPMIFDDEERPILSCLPGKEVVKLPKNIEIIYYEIRKCMQSRCFNAAIMLMRKLILHIAIDEGAEEGKSFEYYIKFLCDNGIVPKKSKNKADSVRTLGNSTNHEIENRTKEEAQNCFEFIELLLKVNYEFADEEENE